MKILRNSLAAAVVLTVGVVLVSRRLTAQTAVAPTIEIQATSDFDAPLQSDGTWVDDQTYGRCFRPSEVASDWEPYCDGQWVSTDAGWYWDSDEPWAWACYHYGTWVDNPGFGWIWVPGMQWAPAWVDWRIGGGYVGWAPCAPAGVAVAPASFAFVAAGHFGGPVHRSGLTFNNQTIIRGAPLAASSHQMRTVSGFARPIAMNRGPAPATIEKATGRSVTAVSIQDEVRSHPAPKTLKNVQRNSEPAAAPSRIVSQPASTTPDHDQPREVTPPTRSVENPASEKPATVPVSPGREVTQPPSVAPDRGNVREPAPPQRKNVNPPAETRGPQIAPPAQPARNPGGGEVQHNGGANQNENGNGNRDNGRGQGGQF